MHQIVPLTPKQSDQIEKRPQILERIDLGDEGWDRMKRIRAFSCALNPSAVWITREVNVETGSVVEFGGAESIILGATDHRERNQVEQFDSIVVAGHRVFDQAAS